MGSELGLTIGLVGAGLLLTAAIVTLTLLLLRIMRPADFASRPSAHGLSPRDLVLPSLAGFRVESAPVREGQGRWQMVYTGPDGEIRFTLVKTGSRREAVRVLSGLRHSRSRRIVPVAKIGGDHSYLVCRLKEGRFIAWTNAEWVFIAGGHDPVLLGEFVSQYPY
nr:hypothetical protein [Anaerolineae bacterium]